MSQLPTITNAFVIPGVSASESRASLWVGLVVDERQIAWGECVLHSAESNPESHLNDAIYILQEIIIPSLMGRRVRHLAQHIRDGSVQPSRGCDARAHR
jgi:hypothetical protein